MIPPPRKPSTVSRATYVHKVGPTPNSTPAPIDPEEFKRKFCGSTKPRDTMTYTGDKLIGIGLRHKSGFEPVFDQEQAIALAQMRR